MSSVEPVVDIDYAFERLAQSGLKRTLARRTVLEVLRHSEKHLGSTEIVAAVLERAPSVGRASVFRTLDLLTRLAIVRPTFLTGRAPVYVLMSPQGHHAHIVCLACNDVIEIVECHLTDSLRQIAREYDVSETGHMLEVYGVCPSCRNQDSVSGESLTITH